MKVKFSSFEQITRSRSAGRHLRDAAGFDAIFQGLLGGEFPPALPVRLLGVTASSFGSTANQDEQLGLTI